MKGPLAPFAPGFHACLIEQGYAPTYAERALYLLSLLNRWMIEAGLGPPDLTPDAVDRFLQARRAQHQRMWVSAAAMLPLMTYLRDCGAAPER